MTELKSIILVYSDGRTHRIPIEPVQATVSVEHHRPRRVRCKVCHKQFHPNGIGAHRKFCESRAAKESQAKND